MQSEIETVALDFFADAQADHEIDELENDQGHDHVVDEHGADADALVEHLAGIAFDQARGAAVGGDREYAGQDGACGAAEWDPLESTCRHASLSIL